MAEKGSYTVVMVFLLCFFSNLKGFALCMWGFGLLNSMYSVLTNTTALPNDFLCKMVKDAEVPT